ncbi:hypothetical protein HRbin26_02240 [bacterium HR26]|nr:hypothetical protein HRbin26_02240 [bacterium HR26]
MRKVRRFPDDEYLMPQPVEQWADTLDRLARPSGHDPQLALLGDRRPAEDGRGDVLLAALRMQLGQSPGEGDAQSAGRHVDPARRQAGEQAVRAPEDSKCRGVVSQHREDDAKPCRFSRRSRALCPLLYERLGGCGRAVPDPNPVAGAQQVARHRQPHVSQADEPDVHLLLPPTAYERLTALHQSALVAPACQRS